MQANRPHHFWKYLLATHAAVFALRGLILVLGEADLFIEEAQYWVWSQRPALSYYSKPPMVAYLNWLSTSVFGSTEFAIKLNVLTLGFCYSILTYVFSFELFKDHKEAFFASLLVYALPLNHTTFNTLLTDAPLMVFWALSTLYLWKALQSNHLTHWLALGVFAGLGFLSKYTMVLFAPVALVYIWRYHPAAFRYRGLYVSIAVTLLFTLPVLIWNWQLDFVSFKHLAHEGKKVMTIGKRLTFLLEYVGGQIALISPFLFFFIPPAVAAAFKSKTPQQVYLIVAPLAVFSFFLCYSLAKRVEVNWPFFAYFSLPVLLSHYYRALRHKTLFKAAAITTFLLIVPVFYLSAYLQPIGLNKIVPPKRDPIVRLYGWDDLGARVQELVDKHVDEEYFVFSDSYHVASEVAFYTADQQVPFCINLGRRHNQFDLWEGIEQFEGGEQIGVFVTKQKEIPMQVVDGFDQQLASEVFEVELGGQVIKRFHIVVLKGLRHIEQQSTERY